MGGKWGGPEDRNNRRMRETSERRLQESRQDDRGSAGAERVKGKAHGLRDALGVALTRPADGLDM